MKNIYDVIVVGAGHAGLEATFACANQKLNTLLVTLNKDGIGACPCNPSVGGPAKGIVTREIDALGGMQAKAVEKTQLQMKLLNSSKGPGVWALRAQVDIIEYHDFFLKEIAKNKNISLLIDEVIDLIIEKNEIKGIVCKNNKKLLAKKVILTTGTYMKSITHIGQENFISGPDTNLNNEKMTKPQGFQRSNFLSDKLKSFGLNVIRLKTGTPPRIKTNSCNFNKMQKESGTNAKLSFAHFKQKYLPFKNQIPCYLTYTNEKTHKIIQKNIHLSAMYSGNIKGVGPRYCPSIEDKIVRFSDKPRHQLFVEPVSKKLNFVYLQGMSTSLPANVQEDFIRTIKGLEKAEFVRYAYAIEYDAFDPQQLWPTLESKIIKNLYLAGQINGTSGYEEAAGQGLIAGINAGLSIRKKKPLILKREECYIGVMIDDIITKGINDPYRLLTSRAEHRLYLRNDNADDRLMEYGYKIGLIKKNEWNFYISQKKIIKNICDKLKKTTLGEQPNLQKKYGSSAKNLYQLLKRPSVKLSELIDKKIYKKIPTQTIEKIEIEAKFEGYIKKQIKHIKNISKFEYIDISKIKDYKKVTNLSLEAIDKLNKIKPLTLGQAQRIQGINLNDIVIIKCFLERNK